MNTKSLNPRKTSTIAIACALSFAAALTAAPRAASAEQPTGAGQLMRTRIEQLPARDLEKAFWICDHTAATRGIDAAPVELCSAVYTTLRDQKFGGDFNELLAWWKQNKEIEHSALAAGM